MNPTVKYKKLDPRAQVPAYATPGAAAADLCAVLDEPLTLAPMQRTLVPTGLAIELPDASCVALVYARSGLSIKHGLCMANGVGVIDSDYRGELRVPMVNLSDTASTIQPGERVAQLCIAPVWRHPAPAIIKHERTPCYGIDPGIRQPAPPRTDGTHHTGLYRHHQRCGRG